MMKPKIIDAIGFGLIAIAVIMTVLLFFTVRGPVVAVRDVTIHEISPEVAPPVKHPHGQSI